MSLPMTIVSPSIWMQKSFFHAAEQQRAAKIGTPSPRDTKDYQLDIRLMAIAHSTLQLLYATLAVVPACIVTAISHVYSGGRWCDMSRDSFLRLVRSVGAAGAALFSPVVASVCTALNVRQLSNTQSSSVQLPISCHGSLFALTLPPLTDHTKNDAFIASLGRKTTVAGYAAIDPSSTPPTFSISIPDMVRANIPVYEQMIGARWRTNFPLAMIEMLKNDLSDYYRAFDPSSEVFGKMLGEAVLSASWNKKPGEERPHQPTTKQVQEMDFIGSTLAAW